MTGSSWVDGLFGTLLVLSALYSIGRLAASRRGENSVQPPGEATHLLMALGMAAMFLPAADPLPRAVWLTVFVLNGAWLLAGLPKAAAADGRWGREQRHHLHLAVSSGAMVYMLAMMGPAGHEQPTAIVALPGTGGAVLAHDHGAGGVSLVPVTAALALYFLAHVLWTLVTAIRTPEPDRRPDGPVATIPAILVEPRLTTACHVVMGLGMAYMFTLMLG
ncbi:DUF5134 domain-containing protein [Actinokineospora iranica]|uniref:DUF5134 domain-containing protein n=1 Tax=Actinokineospora iranica TaxID=1271860 RepID=A0A1G6LE10_9PSEU|nr:DUF5134 domain-containing protein [Actinokineospora iranica]SDC41433.1 protein of unknown function [Actinokineospora iranica]